MELHFKQIYPFTFNVLASKDYAKSFHYECGHICVSEVDWMFSRQDREDDDQFSEKRGEDVFALCSLRGQAEN